MAISRKAPKTQREKQKTMVGLLVRMVKHEIYAQKTGRKKILEKTGVPAALCDKLSQPG